MAAWTKVKTDFETTEYRHSSGARVYSYLPKAFKGREWGVQLARDPKGCGGFASMTEAKAYVERFA